jgi:glycine betaine/proline transport system ATP-binding protein
MDESRIADDTTTPAIACRRLWKLYGTPRQIRAALPHLDPGAERQALQDRFDVFAAVAGVDMSVARREVLAVIGLSGSGKSTLVRHLNALVPPSAGTVEIDGTDIASLSPPALRRLRATQVGMVFQQTSLFPHRSVLDNVAYGLEIQGVPRERRYAEAERWLARMQLAKWSGSYPDQLSGGMQQRVGLARTLITDPEILLLDEPFSALDPIIRHDLQEQFSALCRELHKTAVFITHDFVEALRVADRIAVMKDGKFVQIDVPRAIVARPASDYVGHLTADMATERLLVAGDFVVPGKPPTPIASAQPMSFDTPLSKVLSRLGAEDVPIPVVGSDGRSLGFIDRANTLRQLATRH